MKKLIFGSLLAFAMLFGAAVSIQAQNNKSKNADLVDVAMTNSDFSTLVAAVKAADLVDTLKGSGPFTVFAPTNAAFNKLPQGTVANLVKPENKATLTKVLTYHVVPGKVLAHDLIKLINGNNGTATVKTVSGDTLTAKLSGKSVILTDEKGMNFTVTATDVKASNGVIHVIDGVLMPE